MPHAEERARRGQVQAVSARRHLDNWVAPDLTANERTGLGGWSIDDIAEYLRTGRNAHARRRRRHGGCDHLLHLADERRRPSRDGRLFEEPNRESDRRRSPHRIRQAMRRGAEIYSDACASCHLENGVGQPRFSRPLAPTPCCSRQIRSASNI